MYGINDEFVQTPPADLRLRRECVNLEQPLKSSNDHLQLPVACNKGDGEPGPNERQIFHRESSLLSWVVGEGQVWLKCRQLPSRKTTKLNRLNILGDARRVRT